jgi:hypothetical protein
MKARFSFEDDRLLSDAVDRLGTLDWSAIAKELPGRNARQCRERWRNYVSPTLIHDSWTGIEDEQLVKIFSELGSKWRDMTAFFPGRSRNSIHNRVRTLQLMQREKETKSNTDADTPETSQDTDKDNRTARNQDAMSFLDFPEEDRCLLWFNGLRSDSDFSF